MTYHLVSGEGDDNNTLFTLDQNGTLKTATVFDFESNASSYSIRVQVSDEENASLEGNFTVVLTNDVHEDSDGDGFSDVLEASAGTNPNQASSKPGLNFGLVAWYPFDGNASDMSGNGNHGTVNGATLGTDRHGVAGKAYSFDGVDDYIESTGDFVCPKYSIGAWLRSQSDGQRNIMTIKQVDSHYNTYLALEHYPVDSSHRFRYLHRNPPGNSGGIDAYSTNSLNDGFWYYINAIHDGSVNALFVNGEKVSEVSVTDSFSLVSGLLHVGVNNENRYFHGSIDDIRIYDRALSAEEIRLLYDTEAELPVQSVTSAKLSPVLSDLIDGNGSLEQALPAGSVIARKPGEAPPPGYTLFQRNEYNASLVWEEKAPISIARFAFDGAEVIDGEIYFTGMQVDHNSPGSTLLERYNPSTDTWETLAPRSKVRYASCSTVLNGKYYVMGGRIGDGSVEIYDPETNSWSEGVPMPVLVDHCAAITYEGKIYVIGNNQVIVFDPSKNKWELKAECGLSSWGTALALYQNRIWSFTQQGVESYDPFTDTWRTEASPSISRQFGTAWTYQGKFYFACGRVSSADSNNHYKSIEVFNAETRSWEYIGEFPDARAVMDSVIIDDHLYLVGGAISSLGYTNSMYSAKLPLVHPMNLYFKDGNASAESELSTLGMADGSVTLGQLAPDTLAKIGLDHNPATAEGNLLAVPRGTQPPPGYALYKRSDRNGSLFWEEKAPVSVGRNSADGVVVMGEKLHFIAGYGYIDGASKKITESYDPKTNTWKNLQSLNYSRAGVATASLGGKIYAFGGEDRSDLEIYDPLSNTWTLDSDNNLPSIDKGGSAITIENKMYFIDGNGTGESRMFAYDPVSSEWSQKSNMPVGRTGFKLVWFQKRIWAIGGWNTDAVESYDIYTDTWRTETNLPEIRGGHVAWVAQDKIFVLGRWGGGYYGATDEIIVYNPITATWSYHSQFPTVIGCAGSAILDGKVYVVGGRTSSPADQNHSSRVFAADITPPMDLYYRENSSAGSVTLGKLSSDIIGKLNQSKSVSLTAGMVTSVDYNNNASNEYTILERTDRNASHQWEEMAPLNEIRNACDGVEALDGKIYFVGGRNFDTLQSHNKFERFDPVTNTWETLDPLSVARGGSACAVLDGKLYVIGGQNLTSVEIYDPVSNSWSVGVSLPNEVNHGTAITVDKEIYLISGRNSSDSNINKVFCFDSTLNKWSEKANAPTTRHGAKLVWYENRIWAIGGVNDTYLDVVESYDPFTDTWRSENSLSTPRHWAVAWVENNKIYVGGGSDGSSFLNRVLKLTIVPPANGRLPVSCPLLYTQQI